jgi:putative tricarboxylic transport membrane protein
MAVVFKALFFGLSAPASDSNFEELAMTFKRLLAIPCWLFAAANAFAQGYPTRPIELVSPTGAGGGSDLVARTVAEIVAREKLLPQQIYVQNRAGGGGAIGQTYVAGKRGDPYVFIQAASGLITVPLRTGLDAGADKFTPLGAIGRDLNSIAVSADSPWRTLKDLIDAARAKPKTISVGTTAPGGGAHGLMHKLQKMTGAQFNIVSFKSGAESVTAVMGGHIQATAENLGEVMPQVETKKLRLLGVPSLNRVAGLANVPTLKEQGYDIQAGGLRGFAAPAGIPREAAKTLEDMLAKVHKSAAWRDYMTRNMYEDIYMNADEFAKWLAAQQSDMAAMLGEMGLLMKK